MLKKWEEVAKEKGAHGLQLEADKRNVEFYKKMGFKEVGFLEKGYFGTSNYIFFKVIQEPKEENFLK